MQCTPLLMILMSPLLMRPHMQIKIQLVCSLLSISSCTCNSCCQSLSQIVSVNPQRYSLWWLHWRGLRHLSSQCLSKRMNVVLENAVSRLSGGKPSSGWNVKSASNGFIFIALEWAGRNCQTLLFVKYVNKLIVSCVTNLTLFISLLYILCNVPNVLLFVYILRFPW